MNTQLLPIVRSDDDLLLESVSIEKVKATLRLVNFVLKNKPPQLQSACRVVLRNLLFRHPQYMSTVIDLAFSNDPQVSSGYFLGFADSFFQQNSKTLAFVESTGLHRILNLLLLKLGALDSHECRFASARLLQIICRQAFGSDSELKYLAPDSTSVCDSFLQFQCAVSFRIARDHSELSLAFFEEVIKRFQLLTDMRICNQMLNYISEWMQNIHFDELLRATAKEKRKSLGSIKSLSSLESASPSARNNPVEFVLENLCVLTWKYDHEMNSPVYHVWNFLCRHKKNVPIVIDYCIRQCLRRRNREILELSSKICVMVAQAEPQICVDYLLEQLPKVKCEEDRPSGRSHSHSNGGPARDAANGWTLEEVLPTNRATIRAADLEWMVPSRTLSRGVISMCLLGDILLEKDGEFVRHLPSLLHCFLLEIDHDMELPEYYSMVSGSQKTRMLSPAIYQYAKRNLYNLLHKLIVGHKTELFEKRGKAETEQLEANLQFLLDVFSQVPIRFDRVHIQEDSVSASVSSSFGSSSACPPFKDMPWNGSLSLESKSSCSVALEKLVNALLGVFLPIENDYAVLSGNAGACVYESGCLLAQDWYREALRWIEDAFLAPKKAQSIDRLLESFPANSSELTSKERSQKSVNERAMVFGPLHAVFRSMQMIGILHHNLSQAISSSSSSWLMKSVPRAVLILLRLLQQCHQHQQHALYIATSSKLLPGIPLDTPLFAFSLYSALILQGQQILSSILKSLLLLLTNIGDPSFESRWVIPLVADVFWTAIVMLNSNIAQHYCGACRLLVQILRKLQSLSSSSSYAVLLHAIQLKRPKLLSSFHGLQRLILRGLTSTTDFHLQPEVDSLTIKILSKLVHLSSCVDMFNTDNEHEETSLKNSIALFGPSATCLFINVVSLIPWLISMKLPVPSTASIVEQENAFPMFKYSRDFSEKAASPLKEDPSIVAKYLSNACQKYCISYKRQVNSWNNVEEQKKSSSEHIGFVAKVATLLINYSEGQYTNMDSFTKDFTESFSLAFLESPQNHPFVDGSASSATNNATILFSFYVQILLTGPPCYRSSILLLLKYLIPYIAKTLNFSSEKLNSNEKISYLLKDLVTFLQELSMYSQQQQQQQQQQLVSKSSPRIESSLEREVLPVMHNLLSFSMIRNLSIRKLEPSEHFADQYQRQGKTLERLMQLSRAFSSTLLASPNIFPKTSTTILNSTDWDFLLKTLSRSCHWISKKLLKWDALQ